jgi:alanine dehydrogenase
MLDMRYYPSPEKGLSYTEVNRTIEAVFAEHGKGRVTMPPKLYITLPRGDFRTMPAYVPALDMCGVKVVNVHPNNREHHLPTVMATTILLDVATGLPYAVIHATGLTDMRTGAAGAIAASHLAPSKDITLGIIGSGRQAEAQIAAISTELTVQELRIWGRTESNAEKLAARWASLNARATSTRASFRL